MKKLGIFLAGILTLGILLGAPMVSAAPANVFPDDLFSSADVCGQYFANADIEGLTYGQEDGEWVATLPIHRNLDFMYTKQAIPYDTFTVSFDFYLIISPDSHFHEMDFLFGMSGGPKPFHQASLVCQGGSLMLRHYTMDAEWSEFTDDTVFCDVYEEECWQHFTAEITPEEVSIYLNDEYMTTFSETAGFVGEKGYIGLRAGSAGGWKIKNLVVSEGTLEGTDPEPTAEVTAEPTQDPSEAENATPEQSAAATAAAPTANASEDKDDEAGGFPWLIAGIIAAVVVVAGGAAVWFAKKKKK